MTILSKGRPWALMLQDRKQARTSIDEKESAKVRVRSGGRCECVVSGERCKRRALHVHHLLSGVGTRGRKTSALAENKVHACADCHRLIHAHVLVHKWGKTFQHLR